MHKNVDFRADENDLAAMLAAKRSAVVASEMNLMEHI